MIKNLLRLKRLCTIPIFILALQSQSQAQNVISSLSSTYQQNFDGMGATPNFVPNWTAVKASGTSTVATGATLTMMVSDGSANSGAIYNAGSTGGDDRAFGSLASGSVVPRFGTSFKNLTGQTITSVNLKGVMEQWRSGTSNVVTERVIFEYSLNASSLMEGTWTALPAFDLVEKLTSTTSGSSVNGNLDANRELISATLEAIQWSAGEVLWIRWTDKDDAGSDGIYTIDDFELTAHASGVTPVDITPPTLAAVIPFSPADDAIGIALGTSLTITFSEDIKTGTGSIVLVNLTDGTTQPFLVTNPSAVTISGKTVTLIGANLTYGKNYAVQVPAGALTDLSDNAFPGFSNNTTWNFATEAAPVVVVNSGTTLTAIDIAYTQDFNGMGATGTTFPTNWFAVRAGGTGTKGELLSIGANTGSTSSGGVYNVGASGSGERALGTLASGSTIPAFGTYFTNNTSKIITSVDIAGIMEQWKSGANTVKENVAFEYSLNATSLTDGTWTKLTALDFDEILTTTTAAAAVDGNQNKKSISGTISNIGWRVGNTLWIRWTDADDTGSDGMYALDDFELIPRAVADVTAPTLASSSPFVPQAGDLLVDHEANLSISFSEIVEKGTGALVIKNVTDNTVQYISIESVNLNGNRATFSASLLPQKSYEVTVAPGVFEDLVGNPFAGIETGVWQFTTAVYNPYAQNFNRCETTLPGGWTQFSAAGDTEVWACTTFGRTGNGVQVNGFNGGNKLNEDWLISPAYDLSSGYTYPLLSFWSRTRFAGESLKLMVSTDYSGTGNPAAATWKELNGLFPALNSDAWSLSQNINLGKFKSKTVYIAFVYTSTTSSASRWTLDDVAITNSEVAPVTPVFFSSTLGPLSNFDFGYVTSTGAPETKSFTFSALDLQNNLSLTAPAGFELSKDNTTFSGTLTYTPDETFDNSTVFVRFTPIGTSPAAFAGSIKFTADSFTTQRGYLTATTLDKDQTLDVVTWNIEWFGSTGLGPSNESLQMENAKKMILAQDAEVYCVEEIANVAAFENLVKQLPGYRGFLSPFVSGSGGDNAQRVGFIYKTSAIDSVAARGLLANPANPANFWASGRLPYLFIADATVAGVKKRIHFVAIHAKANENGSTADAQSAYDRRFHDIQVLKDSLDLYYPEANIMMLGDFNDDVDFTVANVPTTTSTYFPFINDKDNYRAVTKDLSDAALRTYITFDNVIDHLVISNELYADYVANSAKVVIPFDLIQNYAGTTSDHLPVSARFQLKPNVRFAVAAESVSESASVYNVQLQLSRPSLTDQTLTVKVQPGTGITAGDYSISTQTLTVPAGETTVHLPVSILNDDQVELDETLTIQVTNATGSIGFASSDIFTLTILDDDASVVSFHESSVNLGEGAGTYTVKLVADQAPVTDQVVTITPRNTSTATYNLDYTTTPAVETGSFTLTFPAGATSANFTLHLQDDTLVEPTEQISFALTSGSSKVAVGTANTFGVTVLDNDKSIVNFATGTATISENAGSYQVQLSLDQAPVQAQTLVVDLLNSNGATYGPEKGQYTTSPAAVNGKVALTLPAGATSASFVVVVNNNPKNEPNKRIEMRVSETGPALATGATASFALTVLDESNPEVKGLGNTQGLAVAPNPSNGQVSLLVENSALATASNITLTLWDGYGKNVLLVTGNLNTITQHLNQKLDQSQKGMYVLKVVTGTTYYQTKLIRD